MLDKVIRIFRRFIDKMEIRKHNEYTIEEYFRKRGYFIGKNNRIFIRYFGTEPYLIRLAIIARLPPGLNLSLTMAGPGSLEKKSGDQCLRQIEIKDNCFIGLDSIILRM